MRKFAAAVAVLLLAGCADNPRPPAEDSSAPSTPGLPFYRCDHGAAERGGGNACLTEAESHSATTAHEVTGLVRDPINPDRLHMAVRDTGPTDRPAEADGGGPAYPTIAHLLLSVDGGTSWTRIEGPDWETPDGLPPTAVRTSLTIHSMVPDGDGGIHAVGTVTHSTGSAIPPAIPVLFDDSEHAFHAALSGEGDWSAPTYWPMAPGAPPPSLVRAGAALVAFRVDDYALVRASTSHDGGATWVDQPDEERAECVYPANALTVADVPVLACFDFDGNSPSYAFDVADLTYHRLGSIPTDDVTGFFNSPTAAGFGPAGIVLALDAEDAWYYSLDSGGNWTKGFDLSVAASFGGAHPSGFGAMAGDAWGRLHLTASASRSDDAQGLTGETVRAHLVLDVPARSIVADRVLERLPLPASDPAGETDASATVYVSSSAPAFALTSTDGLVAFTSNEDAVVGRFAFG